MTTLGKGITHIWPYGKKARLLMVWISTQVVRQKKHKTSRVIMLPFTLRQLMEDLGIQWKPRKTDYEDFKRQISGPVLPRHLRMAVERIYALNHSRAYQTPLITWKSLQNQMGSNYAETRNLVTRFKQSQKHVAALWNAALADAGAEGRFHYSIEKVIPPMMSARQHKNRHRLAL